MVSPAVRTVLLGGPSPEARAIFAKMTTPPTGLRRSQIDACIKALKSAGVWTQLDALYMLAANDEQASRINWKNPANSLTAVNSPTFTTDSGWAFASTKSLKTGYDYNAGVTGAHYTIASAQISTFAVTNASGAGKYDMGCDITGAAFINSRETTGITARLNFGTGSDGNTATVASSLGHTIINRDPADTATTRYVRNGILIQTRAIGGSVLPGEICIGNLTSTGTQFTNRTIASAGFGGGLTPAQEAAYYNAIYAYIHAVGAI